MTMSELTLSVGRKLGEMEEVVAVDIHGDGHLTLSMADGGVVDVELAPVLPAEDDL